MLSKAVEATFKSLCSSLNTPRSLAAWLMLSNDEHLQFSQMEIKPLNYLERDFEKFRDDYLVTEYLSKYKGLDTNVDLPEVAYGSFVAAEDQCRSANERIRQLWTHNGSCGWADILCRAQLKIQSCLGTHPSWHKLADRFKWGPGATSTLKGFDARIDSKLREEQISVTKKALPYIKAAMACDYAWLHARGLDAAGPVTLLDSEFRVVRGSRGLTVPKNAKTDRFIAAEPTGNVFLQLGVGNYFRQCLRRVGINLDDQTINQALAKSALEDGLATVDLKAASDTIPSALVWQLLPYSWASLLWDLRSPEIQIKGEYVPLEKFSSMGNGFTFELESLIFWALTESLRDAMGLTGRVSVYGDDIICPSEMVPRLTELLSFCGFTLNVKKSHSTGLFRESCGKHYFGGKDVTPIYQKDVPDAEEHEAYRFHNRLLYHALDRGYFDSRGVTIADRKLRAAVKSSKLVFEKVKQVHEVPIAPDPRWRTLDGGVATSLRNAKRFVFMSSERHNMNGLWRTQVLAFVPKEVPCHVGAFYAVVLRSTHGRSSVPDLGRAFAGTINVRGRGSWRRKRRYFPEARDLLWV